MSDICLFTTTIYNPVVLRQYRASDPDVLFIIAGDLKTPHEEVRALCKELGNAVYLDPFEQGALGYACSDVIAWRTIQRRNIALLEAIRSGADVVLSVDDDNAPRNRTYFRDLRKSLDASVDFVVADEWFNLGEHADMFFFYRGYPFSRRDSEGMFEYVKSEGRVGIVNGLIYGDPDINAIDRYLEAPRVDRYYAQPFVVNPRTTWTPINSQNTAYVRELAPLAFVLPGVGRYDDIWASYMALRVMEATDYHVYFGEPSVIQERNPHNWIIDAKNEWYGVEHTEAFCKSLKDTPIDEGASVLDNLDIVRTKDAAALLPRQAREFLDAWVDDVAGVL